MTRYYVRVATPADAEGVSELLRASYPVSMAGSYEASVLTPALEWITRANPRLLASGTYFIAESARGLIVGCGGWSMERPGDSVICEDLGHIRHFGTHPDWIRQGIGKALYGRCEAEARDAGLLRLECYSSLNAELFYAALGFERVRGIDVELPDGIFFPAVLMQRSI